LERDAKREYGLQQCASHSLQISPKVEKTVRNSVKILWYVIVKVRRILGVICSRFIGIECSTFFWQRVAKLSTGLFPPAFVITNNKFMNVAKVKTKF